MVAGLTQREIISKALFALSHNEPSRFEDILWLAYGDDWTVILRSLISRGIVRYSNARDTHAITDEGRRMLGTLRQAGHGVTAPAQSAD